MCAGTLAKSLKVGEREKKKYKWDSGKNADFNSNIDTDVINGNLRNVSKIA
jgi:hypothetical protein